MKIGEILANSVLQISEESTWSKTKSFDELESLSHDELLFYAKDVICQYVELGYKLHEVADYVKFCQKYKLYIEVK